MATAYDIAAMQAKPEQDGHVSVVAVENLRKLLTIEAPGVGGVQPADG